MQRHTPQMLLAGLLTLSAASLAAAPPRIVPVSTPNQLQSAIDAARDGDVIELADGTYPVSGLSGSPDFFFIADPAVHFTIRAASPGAAILDGGGSLRILEYRVDTTGAEGWVTFQDLVFQNGRTSSFDAGAVTTRGGRSTFLNCVFRNNQGRPGTTSGAAAGAVMLTAESVAQFFDCTFDGNVSDNHGGAMLVGQGSTAYILNSVVVNNRNNLAGHRPNGLGGAIHAFNGLAGTTTSLYVTNTRFDSNQGAFAGGAIMAKGNFADAGQPVPSPTVVVVANSTFVDNIALNNPTVTPASPTEGGAIMVENNASASVFNSRFVGNSGGLGGALSSYRGVLTVASSVFIDNTAFGRAQTTSAGQGGAIKSHSNDSCSSATNIRTGSLSVTDSFFEGNQAQWGGAIFAAGDQIRMFSTTPGCQMGGFATNRLPVVLDHVTISNCSVDDVIGDHAVGGGIYGLLVDLTLTDSMVLDSSASGTDPSDPASSSQGHGGGASIRTGSRLTVTDTTFAGNTADHEGGALHIFGSQIASFSGNTFVGNQVSPGGSRPETLSEGAALFLSPAVPSSLDVSGAITDSVFTDNVGLPIFDSDTTDANSCNCFNLVTYDGNTFYNTTYGDAVYRDSLVAGTHDADALNSLVVDHGGGTLTPKSLLGSNLDEVSPVTTAAILAAPEGVIGRTAAGDTASSTESYLAWAWNGGCAELNQDNLIDGAESTGTLQAALGTHLLEVWDGGACVGAPDLSRTDTVLQRAVPSAELVADPAAIAGGQSTTLSWSMTGGTLVTGMISNDALDTVSAAAGSIVVAPPATTGYHLGIVTKQGGAAAHDTVYVDESPPTTIFSDGFESGDTGAWSGGAR